MGTEHLNLHDALLKTMHVDYVARVARIELEFYANDANAARKWLAIDFHGVSVITQTVDLDALKEHEFAGTISDWKPADGPGPTYLYLPTGCVSITCDKLGIVVGDS